MSWDVSGVGLLQGGEGSSIGELCCWNWLGTLGWESLAWKLGRELSLECNTSIPRPEFFLSVDVKGWYLVRNINY